MKKNIVIALTVLISITTICLRLKKDIKNICTSNANIINKPVIIIDAGHGGYDGGAVALDGTVEKDINLCIAKNLQKFLVCAGFDVKMTRETDEATDGSGMKKYVKTRDLNNRLKLMKEYPESIFVSIHLNKFTTSSANGAQVFYAPSVKMSDVLANCIQSSIVSLLQPENTRTVKQGTKSIYILKNATVPSVIIECGFLSNREELEKLKDEKYQSMMAFSVFCGIIDYYNSGN